MDNWYIWAYETKKYLHHRTLKFRQIPYDENNHWHCELCWARFSKYNGDLQKGYYESNSNSWICQDCYQELNMIFDWKVEDDM